VLFLSCSCESLAASAASSDDGRVCGDVLADAGVNVTTMTLASSSLLHDVSVSCAEDFSLVRR
jgi:hypothetical protein